ncbi:hypothetical protein CCACVL1_02789 [Corchorus capsularis]|uniref:Uncharacterized protein n=1 Tax=Corchorus capsularis TaxID=210143 RepID=A0A1R3K5Y1_COCAP|nr:hypothetical protein CCACVL1_02789 [Corchorus capsularis]
MSSSSSRSYGGGGSLGWRWFIKREKD